MQEKRLLRIFLIILVVGFSFFFGFLHQSAIHPSLQQVIDTSTTSTAPVIHDPVTSPPICDQSLPYRVKPPNRIIPGNNISVAFELCLSVSADEDDAILQLRKIGSGDTGWVNVSLVLQTDLLVTETKIERTYLGQYYFDDCTAIEGRYMLVSPSTGPATGWVNIEIPRTWACGSQIGGGINTDVILIALVVGLIFVGGIYSVSKIRDYKTKMPSIIRYEKFIKMKNFSKRSLHGQKNLEKKYRIIESTQNVVELYRKDGRNITEEDFKEVLDIKNSVTK